MNEHDTSRILLLEQLESRCMLAGGILLFSTHSNEAERPAVGEFNNKVVERSAVEEFDNKVAERSAVEEFDNKVAERSAVGIQTDRPALESQHNDLDRSRSSEHTDPRSSGNDLGNAQSDRNPTGTHPNGELAVGNSSIANTSPPSARPNESGLGSGNLRQSSQPPVAGSPANTPAVSTSLGGTILTTANESGRDAVSPAGSVRTATQTVSATDDGSSIEATSNTKSSNEPVSYVEPVAGSAVYEHNGETNGGTVELLPLLRHSVPAPEPTEIDEPWEMDTESLQQLRNVTRGDIDGPNATDQGRIDSAIVSWFGGATGLIDNMQAGHELPVSVENLAPSIVDVVLDATVGLHRSVGLIAAADASAHPTQIRDAILAAIASEQPIVADAVDAPKPSRYSGLAYPGAAIIAGTLALATHRRKTAKLESSR